VCDDTENEMQTLWWWWVFYMALPQLLISDGSSLARAAPRSHAPPAREGASATDRPPTPAAALHACMLRPLSMHACCMWMCGGSSREVGRSLVVAWRQHTRCQLAGSREICHRGD
jgi:hypothetical protein